MRELHRFGCHHLVRWLLVTCWLILGTAGAGAACPGCCSSHGGITSSCAANGRVYCKDGSVSPSCTCSACGVSTGTSAPTCYLVASPTTITFGGSSQLSASCSPAPTTYNWTNSGFSSTQASGTVKPAATTTYSVRATNSGGTGNTASATVTVTAPTCTGGMEWNGSACACPAGKTMVDGECFAPLPSTACGVERWSIKTGTDSGALTVNTRTAVPTTVTTMGAIPAPASLPATTRITPVELTTYVLDATLIKYRFTEDSDYHLVLADAAGRTMIVELPHPDCVGSASPFKGAITAVRAAFDGRLRATTTFKSAAIPVRVHGVGFWDDIHGQTGVAPNGIELHPVLRLEFNPTGTQGSVTSFPLATDADRLFNWAEAVFPGYFPKPGTAGTFEGYTYRYYSKTGTYVATSGGRVIVHNGKEWNMLDVGALVDFITGAAASGY